MMDVIAGKSGSFFAVKGKLKDNVIETLSTISFDEFGKYNAYGTMKKISRISPEDYASNHGLDKEILENFSELDNAVDFKLTQDLMYFIESDDGRRRSESFGNDVVINPANYSNGFALAAPREIAGVITDPFQIKDDDVPLFMKKVGIASKRKLLSNFVKWNDITYRVDIVPETSIPYKGTFDNKSVTIVEYCYIFESDDWRRLKNIEYRLDRAQKRRKKWFFLKEKPEDELLQKIIKKLFKKEVELVKFTRMFESYRTIKDIRHDYRGVAVRQIHHLKNKIILENRRLKANSKCLRAEDMYHILVEDERSAALMNTIDKINLYWHDGNWENLLAKESCFKILEERSQETRDRLLKNMEFVVNARLQLWNEEQFNSYQKTFVARLAALEAQNSCAKGEDVDGAEYCRQLSIIYSMRVYNPDKKKYEFRRLDKYIKIPILFNPQTKISIIDRAQYFIDRKKSSMSFLIAKYGINKNVIWKAAKIYDSYRRIKRVNNLNNC